MLDTLSTEQERMLPAWREKWRRIALSCEPMDIGRSRDAVADCYRVAGLKPPKRYHVSTSPAEAARVLRQLRRAAGCLFPDAIIEPAAERIAGTAREGILRGVAQELVLLVMAGLETEFLRWLWAPVGSSIADALGPSHFREINEPPAHRLHILATADFLAAATGRPPADSLAAEIELAQCSGGWIPLSEEAIIHDRPCDVHVNTHGLHREDGPAARYRDGFCVWAMDGLGVPRWLVETSADDINPLWFFELENPGARWAFLRKAEVDRVREALDMERLIATDELEVRRWKSAHVLDLERYEVQASIYRAYGGGSVIAYPDARSLWSLNGVVVPPWLAVLRSEDIDPRMILGLWNVDVRREFVRKVGLERICQALRAECVDRMGDYELLMLDLGDGRRRRPYLKMLNPSVGTWHVEGVDPDCRTVAEALAWRNQTHQPPEVLT